MNCVRGVYLTALAIASIPARKVRRAAGAALPTQRKAGAACTRFSRFFEPEPPVAFSALACNRSMHPAELSRRLNRRSHVFPAKALLTILSLIIEFCRYG